MAVHAASEARLLKFQFELLRTSNRSQTVHFVRVQLVQPSCYIINVTLVFVQSSSSSGFVAAFANQIRVLPLAAGAAGFLALLANRFSSGTGAIVDAGSSQSRVDVLVILLAATLALTGFQWLALKPVKRLPVCFCALLCRTAPAPWANLTLSEPSNVAQAHVMTAPLGCRLNRQAKQ